MRTAQEGERRQSFLGRTRKRGLLAPDTAGRKDRWLRKAPPRISSAAPFKRRSFDRDREWHDQTAFRLSLPASPEWLVSVALAVPAPHFQQPDMEFMQHLRLRLSASKAQLIIVAPSMTETHACSRVRMAREVARV